MDDDCDGLVDNGCGPCVSDGDCHALDLPATCGDASTCQGTRQVGVCDAFQQCVPSLQDDDSGCAGLPSSDCGPYPGIACTTAAEQPAGQESLCASSCSADGQCDPAGHCDETQGACLYDFPPGFGCVAAGDCTTDLCVDGVCCTSGCSGTCVACDLTGSTGTCAPVPDGQDPDTECGAVSCAAYYYGFIGDACYRKADVSSSQAACGGDSACRSAAEECTAQTAQGPVALVCDSLCQDPKAGTCSGTTPGSCANVNPGTQTCGQGVCQVTVPLCSNGSPNTCVPNSGAASPETCNDIDDNCDGAIDNGPFADGREPNGSCAAASTLPTVGSDQALTQNTLTLYPSGDVDYFRINATETDSSCACCDLFCTDEDYRLHITLTVPSGAGSYQFCTALDCATWSCQSVSAGSSFTWQYNLDGACGVTNDAYTAYVRISPGAAPGFECAPYILSYFFDALVCN